MLLVDVRFCKIFINYLVKLNEWIKMLGNCDNLLKLFGSKYENMIYLSIYDISIYRWLFMFFSKIQVIKMLAKSLQMRKFWNIKLTSFRISDSDSLGVNVLDLFLIKNRFQIQCYTLEILIICFGVFSIFAIIQGFAKLIK